MNQPPDPIGKQDVDRFGIKNLDHFARPEGRMEQHLADVVVFCPVVGRADFSSRIGYQRRFHRFFEGSGQAAFGANHSRDFAEPGNGFNDVSQLFITFRTYFFDPFADGVHLVTHTRKLLGKKTPISGVHFRFFSN